MRHGQRRSLTSGGPTQNFVASVLVVVVVGGGWDVTNGCHEHICPCFTPSRIALEKQYLFHGSVCFQHVFLSRARDCMTFTLLDLTDFCFERVAVHHIRINDHSCFHNCWPNSKTKLKLKHI